MSFDLKSAPSLREASETGYTFEPTYPDSDEGIGARIHVRGSESAVVRALLSRQLAANEARELAARKRGKESESLTIEELEDRAIDLAVAYTIGWEGFEKDGEPYPFTPDNARALYRDWSYIRRQVLEEAQDLGNFARRSWPSSSSTRAPSSGSI